MSKNERNAGVISEYEDIFRCPICSNQMKTVNFKSLTCSSDHCFDLSKHGYVNLLSHSVKTKYNKQMFESRKILCRSGFFEPLNEQISEQIINELKFKSKLMKVLDAGCGEGSHLTSVHQKISNNTANDFLGVGVDISKEGIYIASRDYPHTIWCVADIANCPFVSKQFDIILNILSPSNYSEFQRLLADDGMIIKVIPGSDYLKELREIFYEKTNRQDYSNDNTLELFRYNLDLLDIEHVRYSITLDSTLIDHLVHMTPLSWGAMEGSIQKVLKMTSLEITIDLAILLGRKKKLLMSNS